MAPKNIEAILGNAFAQRCVSSIAEYTPNAIKFRGLSLAALEQAVREDYTTPSASFNAAPSVGSFIEFGQRCQQKGATATFDGIAFNQGEEPHLVVDAIAIIGVQDLDFAGEFVRFVWGCDELEIGSQQLYAWWD